MSLDNVCVFTDLAKTPPVIAALSYTVGLLGSGAIAAGHCISSVNTDDSRKTGSYYMSQSYNRYRYLFQNYQRLKSMIFRWHGDGAARSGQTITIICFRRINSSAI